MKIDQDDIRKILLQKFEQIKKKNSNYSMRSYAKKLNIGSGALSSILSGKRKISKNMAISFSKALNLSDEEYLLFMRCFNVEQLINNGTSYFEISQNTACELEFDHFSFLNLIKTEDFKNNIDFIAKRLNITPERALVVKTQLLNKKLICIDENDEIKRIFDNLSTQDMIPLDYLKRIQKANLEKAIEAIDLSIEIRDITAVTMAINPDRLTEARSLIRKFQNDLCILLESDKKKEVYKLCIQFYPLTF